MIYDSKLVSKKTIWIIIIAVCMFVPAYLYYVKKDRERSIKNYSGQPQVGDIYKIRQDTREDGVFVFYLKVTAVEADNIRFIRSKMIGAIPDDTILKQFDPSRTAVYTRKDLADIAAGKWTTNAQDKTELIEIERR